MKGTVEDLEIDEPIEKHDQDTNGASHQDFNTSFQMNMFHINQKKEFYNILEIKNN